MKVKIPAVASALVLIGVAGCTPVAGAAEPDGKDWERACSSTGWIDQYFDQLDGTGNVQCGKPVDTIWLRVRIQASEIVTPAGFHGVGAPVFKQCDDARSCVTTDTLDCIPNTGLWFRARAVARVTEGDSAAEVTKLHSDPIEGRRYSLACGGKS